MADASSVSVVLGAPSFGPGVVVTSAGVVFAQAAVAPASNANAYWFYDGTNLVGNVPTGKGFSFTVNGTQQASIGATGLATFNANDSAGRIPTIGAKAGSAGFGPHLGYDSGAGLIGLFLQQGAAVYGTANDGASAIATLADTRSAFVTAGAKLFEVRNNGTSPALTVYAVASANPSAMAGQSAFAHIAGGSAAWVPGNPTNVGNVTIGLGAGTTSSGTAVTASGHDMAGRVGVTVNSTGTVSQPILLGSWAANYNRPPFMVAYPGNAAAAAIAVAQAPFVQTTVSGWSLIANTTGLAAGTYVWMLGGVCQ